LTRPSLAEATARQEAEADAGGGDRFVGRNSCRLDPQRSRVTVSNEQNLELSWDAQGCVNQATQYAQDGPVWRRVLVPNQEQTVTVSQFEPASGEYVVSRYLLNARAMDEARRLRRLSSRKPAPEMPKRERAWPTSSATWSRPCPSARTNGSSIAARRRAAADSSPGRVPLIGVGPGET
jgi:hypothetical protein